VGMGKTWTAESDANDKRKWKRRCGLGGLMIRDEVQASLGK